MKNLYESILDDELDILDKADNDIVIIELRHIFDVDNPSNLEFRSEDDGVYVHMKGSSRVTIQLENKKDLDYFLKNCKEILLNSQNSYLYISTSVDLDMKKFPPIKYEDGPNTNPSVTVFELSQEVEKIKLHNITLEAFNKKGLKHQLSMRSYGKLPEVDLTGLSWRSEFVEFDNVIVNNTDDKCVLSSTKIHFDRGSKPGHDVGKYLALKYLNFYIYGSTRSTGELEIVGDTLRLRKDKSYECFSSIDLEKIGIKKIEATGHQTSILGVPPSYVPMMDGFKLIKIKHDDNRNIIFDTSKNSYKNRAYVLAKSPFQTYDGSEIYDVNAVCDTSRDKEFSVGTVYMESNSMLGLYGEFTLKDLKNIKSNCSVLRLELDAELSSTIVDKMMTKKEYSNWSDYVGKKHITVKEMDKIISSKNFPNLRYIILGSITKRALKKVSDKWVIF